MNLDDVQYEILIHEDYITDVEIYRVSSVLQEMDGLNKLKDKKNAKDKRKTLHQNDNDFKNKIISAIHNSYQYKNKTRNMNEREKILFDKKMSKLVSDYFPSIKEYWIKNNCSEEILIQYSLSTLNQALGLVSLEKVRGHKLSESSFMDRNSISYNKNYDITRYPKIELHKEEYKRSLSDIIEESSKYEHIIKSINETNQEAVKQKTDSFLNMVKKMANHFLTFAKKQMGKSKNYLQNKKEDILRKKPGENIPIEMRNYGAGIKNIMTSQMPQFDAIKNTLPGDKVACENTLKQKFIPTYNNFNADFKQWCIAYFEGGSQKVKTNINALNMNEIYSFVTTYGTKILPIIERDTNILTKLGNTSTKISNDIATAERQQNIQNVKNQQNNNSSTNNNNLKTESYLIEAPQPIPQQQPRLQQTPPPQTGAAPANGVPAGDKMVIGKQQGEVQNTNTPANASQQQQQNQSQNANIDKMKLDAYMKVALQYSGAKMTAASTIYQDYMKILMTHAPEKSYAGNASTGLTISNPKDVLKQISDIQKTQDRNKQNKMIQDLIASVQQNNPGFNGGLNDISTAANMALKNGG